MVGLPGQSQADVATTAAFLRTLRPTFVHYGVRSNHASPWVIASPPVALGNCYRLYRR